MFFVRSFGCAFFNLWGIDMKRRYELFGQKLAYCRKDMARLISVSPSTYYKYENGITMPPVYNLYLLAIITEMPMETFVASDLFSLESFIAMYNKTPAQRFLELHEDVMNKTLNI